MLKNVKLRTKIVSLPVIVLLLLVGSGIATYLQLHRIEKDVRDITEDLAPDASKAARLLQNILEKRLVVRAYLKGGDDRFINQFHTLEEANNTLIQEAEASIHNPTRAQLVKDIHHLDEQYTKTFTTDVVGNMEKRQKVMREVMDVQGPFIEKSLSAIHDSAFQDNDPVASHHAAVTLKHFLLARLYLFKYLEDNEDADAARVVDELHAAEEQARRLDAELENAQRKQWSKAAAQALDAYELGFKEVVSAIQTRNKAVKTVLDVNGPKIAEDANKLQASVWHDLHKNGVEVHQRITLTNTMMLVVTVVAVMLGLALAVVISRMITRPMEQMASAADKIAVGDINQTITHQAQDETGRLAEAFRRLIDYINGMASAAEAISTGNLTVELAARSEQDILSQSFQRMITHLRQVFQELTSHASTLSTAANELSAAAHQVSSNAGNMSGKATASASGAQEMSENMNIVATGTEEMTATVGEIAQNAEKARQVALHAAQNVTTASSQVEALSTAARDINQVTEAIMEIAEQTKLLALNATIEAARAGEAGKGFAVVANEVKALAQQTNAATEDIRGKIDAIQQSTTRVVEEIGQINTVMTDVNDSVASIATAVEEQAVTTKDMASTVARAAHVSQEIAGDMGGMRETSAEMEATSTQLQQQAAALATMGEALQGVVSRFTL